MNNSIHHRYPSRLYVLIYWLIVGLYLSACAASGDRNSADANIPYPQPAPASVPTPFLPGIVSSDSLDFNSAFSPDGKAFYFTRTENKQSRIYFTQHNGVAWTAPASMPFAESNYSSADPAFSPDGKLYFISNRPRDPEDTIDDYDIWAVTPSADGHWSDPQNITTLNSDSSEYYISFSGNGNLYFSSGRTGGYGEEDIYVSKLVEGRYTTPENLGPAINTERSEYDPGINASEDLLVFTSSNRSDTFGGADLYSAKANGVDRWTKAKNLGSKFNTPGREYCAYFSRDSKYFFFSSRRDIKWIESKAITQTRKPLRDTYNLPIPVFEFDELGELKIEPSATSSSADFDFLIGKWRLEHEKLRARLNGCKDWDEFETEVEDFKILEGTGNMDIGKAVIDGKAWEGRTIRLFNPATRLWSLYWISSHAGTMDPPVVGSFDNGVGHFFGKDKFNGKPIVVLFRWDARDKDNPVWSQAFSPDNGKTWEWNWYNVSRRIK